MTKQSKISRTYNYFIGALFILFCVAYFQTSKLPEKSAIKPALLEDPVQGETSERPFDFEYADKTYHITPKASYEISGLVISHNNISGIGDMYHNSKSVDVKDLCLAWGDNADPKVLSQYKIWSEPWSCHFSYSGNIEYPLDLERFSNNHLLASTTKIKERINNARKGDQVYLKGYLVDYYPSDCVECVRKSSLVRDDTGNGACEVLYVTQMDVLSANQQGWNKFKHWVLGNLWLLLLVRVVLWVWLPWWEYRNI